MGEFLLDFVRVILGVVSLAAALALARVAWRLLTWPRYRIDRWIDGDPNP